MRIAIITGASSGMGAEFVKHIDREGCDQLWLVARRADRLEALASECTTPARIFAADLTADGEVEKLVDAARAENASVAWLVNAAGFGEFGEVGVQPLDTQMKMIDLNVKAVVKMCTLFAGSMEHGSHIINLGSGSVFNPLPYFAIYSSTKAFILHYSRAIYYEMKERGVTVSVFCPGWVKTEFFDHTRDNCERAPKSYKPMTYPEDVVAYCMKKAKKGKCFIVHGAFTKTQHLMSKILPRRALIKIWLGMLEDRRK